MIITQRTAKDGHCFFSFEIKEAEIKIGHHNVVVPPDALYPVHLIVQDWTLRDINCHRDAIRAY